MSRRPAFIPLAPVALTGHPVTHGTRPARRRPAYRGQPRPATACLPSPPDAASPSAPTTQSPLLATAILETILQGTMLSAEPLALAYTSATSGFDNTAFFARLIPLGGVPSLVLGRTSAGALFGGYAASGFLARDDYREAATPRSMFVFRVADDGDVLVAAPTDGVQYDFYDYAVRFGAALLGVPMNPAKHVMKADVGTSSCRLPNGETSVFGDATLAKIDVLQVWVASKYVEEAEAKKAGEGRGFFARLFG